MEECILRIERNSLYASSFDGTSRSATLKRFPYELIYLVNDVDSEVNIISHQHRKPFWFRKRIIT